MYNHMLLLVLSLPLGIWLLMSAGIVPCPLGERVYPLQPWWYKVKITYTDFVPFSVMTIEKMHSCKPLQ